MAVVGKTPRSVALGAALKEAREACRMSQRKLAAQLGKHYSTISRWESGGGAPDVEETAAILGILGVIGPEREMLLTLARDAADPNLVQPGIKKHLATLIEYERTAAVITSVQPSLVPGVLQTAGYARSIMLAAGATPGEADQRVTYRMGRRDIITRTNPVRFHALIGEAALRHPPCPNDVMADQLRQLQRLADLDNVTIQALPLEGGYTPALEGPFVLLEFDRHGPVVQLEHYRSATTLTNVSDVRDYQAAADRLRREAMTPEATVSLIEEVANRMEIAE